MALGRIWPRVASKKAFQSYEKAISSGVIACKAFTTHETPTRLRVVPSKASSPREKTVTFTSTETFPTRKTSAGAIKPQVVHQFPPPQNYCRSVLGNQGNAVPSSKDGGFPL